MERQRQRRGDRHPFLKMLPRTEAVEREIRELSSRVRVLLDLLPVCRLADNRGERRRSPPPSAKE